MTRSAQAIGTRTTDFPGNIGADARVARCQWLAEVTDAEDPFGEDQTTPTATPAKPARACSAFCNRSKGEMGAMIIAICDQRGAYTPNFGPAASLVLCANRFAIRASATPSPRDHA